MYFSYLLEGSKTVEMCLKTVLYVLVIICLILVQILVVLTWTMYQSNFGDSQSFFGLDASFFFSCLLSLFSWPKEVFDFGLWSFKISSLSSTAIWTWLKYLMCPSAKRLHLSSFSDFPHDKHLIDLPSSEILASVFRSNSFKLLISDNLLGSWLLVTFQLTFSGMTWNNLSCRFFRYSIVWAFTIKKLMTE